MVKENSLQIIANNTNNPETIKEIHSNNFIVPPFNLCYIILKNDSNVKVHTVIKNLE